MSALISLIKGNRLSMLLGYKTEKKKVEYAPDYNFVQVNLGTAYTIGEEGKKTLVKKAKAGQFVKLVPADVVNSAPRYHAVVVYNAALATAGSVSHQSILAPGEGDKLGFSVQFHEDFDLTKLDWLCRIYLID